MKNRSLYKNHDGKKHDNNLCKIAVPPDNSHIPLRKDMCSPVSYTHLTLPTN